MYLKHFITFWVILFLVQTPEEEAIVWQASHPLEWSDFKAKPNLNVDAVALTASGISFGYQFKTSNGKIVDFSTKVSCYFYPEKSWYKKEKANAYILAHEQLHFDITELYARKLRKAMAKLRANPNIKQELEQLYSKINIELYKTQKRYDAETEHSIITEAQQQWNSDIAKALNALSAYAYDGK